MHRMRGTLKREEERRFQKQNRHYGPAPWRPFVASHARWPARCHHVMDVPHHRWTGKHRRRQHEERQMTTGQKGSQGRRRDHHHRRHPRPPSSAAPQHGEQQGRAVEGALEAGKLNRIPLGQLGPGRNGSAQELEDRWPPGFTMSAANDATT